MQAFGRNTLSKPHTACPKHTEYGAKDKDHATIEEIPPDQPSTDESKLISHIPDFPQGTTCSMKQHSEIQSLVSTKNLEEAVIMTINIPGEPMNIKDGLDLPSNKGRVWEHACQIRWQNMVDHDVFGPPEEPPPNMQILKMGTTLQTKKKDGKIINQKVRIVAKGYSQVPGLHSNETYAPIMHWESLCTILTLEAISNQSICQFDVKSAYLHGIIQEDIWIQQLEGFEVPGKGHLALKL